MQRLEFSGAVRPVKGSLGIKGIDSKNTAAKVALVTDNQARN
jgi:hypothetical protein